MEDRPVIWIISALHWPRAYLRAELIERGFDAVGYPKVADALRAFGLYWVAKPALIVMDLHQLGTSDAELDDLVAHGIPLVALVGAVELSGKLLKSNQWAAILQRPFTIGSVADLVQKVYLTVAH